MLRCNFYTKQQFKRWTVVSLTCIPQLVQSRIVSAIVDVVRRVRMIGAAWWNVGFTGDAQSALEHITRGFVTAPARLLVVGSCDDRACAMQLVRNQRSNDGADRCQGQGSCWRRSGADYDSTCNFTLSTWNNSTLYILFSILFDHWTNTSARIKDYSGKNNNHAQLQLHYPSESNSFWYQWFNS